MSDPDAVTLSYRDLFRVGKSGNTIVRLYCWAPNREDPRWQSHITQKNGIYVPDPVTSISKLCCTLDTEIESWSLWFGLVTVDQLVSGLVGYDNSAPAPRPPEETWRLLMKMRLIEGIDWREQLTYKEKAILKDIHASWFYYASRQM